MVYLYRTERSVPGVWHQLGAFDNDEEAMARYNECRAKNYRAEGTDDWNHNLHPIILARHEGERFIIVTDNTHT